MNDLEFTPSPARVRDLKKVDEGRQAELFVWAEGVVKLSRSSRDRSSAQLEAMAMYSLQATGIPLPRIFGTVTIEQRPGIVMERLAGTDQFSLLERKPWLFWTAAKKLAQLHAQIHSMVAPEQLQSLKPSIRREIESSDSMPYESKHLALASLDHLPDGAAVCHWDFHPGNVIETTDGSKVVDWSNVRRGAALADVARTLLIIRAGALPPGTPFLARKLIGFGRSVLGWRYLHEYRRLRPFHDETCSPGASLAWHHGCHMASPKSVDICWNFSRSSLHYRLISPSLWHPNITLVIEFAITRERATRCQHGGKHSRRPSTYLIPSASGCPAPMSGESWSTALPLYGTLS